MIARARIQEDAQHYFADVVIVDGPFALLVGSPTVPARIVPVPAAAPFENPFTDFAEARRHVLDVLAGLRAAVEQQISAVASAHDYAEFLEITGQW